MRFSYDTDEAVARLCEGGAVYVCGCGADHVVTDKARKFRITGRHVDWLSAHFEQNGGVPTHITKLDIPDMQMDSCYPHLVYWGLVARPPGKRAKTESRGNYYITERGKSFLADEVRVPEYVWARHGRFVKPVADVERYTATELLELDRPIVVPDRLADHARFDDTEETEDD